MSEENAMTVIEPQLPDATKGKRFNIPGDVVNRATQDLPDEHRGAIRWLHAYGCDHDLRISELAAKLKRTSGNGTYDENTVYKILTGRHEAKLDNFVEAVLAFKKFLEERNTIKRVPFVKTALGNKIQKLCKSALLYNKIVFIFGESQIGKTAALEDYAVNNNHGETIYVRMPTGGYLSKFKAELCVKLRISPKLKTSEQERRIFAAFDDRMLLIVDEAHQVTYTEGFSRMQTIEFIREIHDRTKCGAVICGTNVFADELKSGRHQKLLRQFDLRSLCKLNLPDKPTRKDLDVIAREYGLEPARGEAEVLQTEIIRDSGLGKWFTYLQAASRIASKAGKELKWHHVIEADAAFKELEAFGGGR